MFEFPFWLSEESRTRRLLPLRDPAGMVYLRLHDNQKQAANTESKADSAEQRKADAKRKKQEAQKRQEEEEAAKKQQQERGGAGKRRGKAPPVDSDPNGDQLVGVADPLAEAAKYVKRIYHQNAGSLGAWAYLLHLHD